mmetsp:Transcript_34659/g.56496  ORF Transcript_34659/g.56496 Transcript_34659/m.56496 type:complete len:219 (+) Transcript_34659:168-824(+)
MCHRNTPRIQYSAVIQQENRIRLITVHVHRHIAPVVLAHSPETRSFCKAVLIQAVLVFSQRHFQVSAISVCANRSLCDPQTITNLSLISVSFGAHSAWIAEIRSHAIHNGAIEQCVIYKWIPRRLRCLTWIIKSQNNAKHLAILTIDGHHRDIIVLNIHIAYATRTLAAHDLHPFLALRLTLSDLDREIRAPRVGSKRGFKLIPFRDARSRIVTIRNR